MFTRKCALSCLHRKFNQNWLHAALVLRIKSNFASNNKAEMEFYWGSGSPPCWRAMLMLAHKGLPFENKLLSFGKKDHKSDHILSLNARGQLPVFKHGNIVLNESLAIMEYLEANFPDKGAKLMPDDPAQRALVMQRKYEALNMQQNVGSTLVVYILFTKEEDRNAEEMAKKAVGAKEELQRWEGYLKKEGGNYIAGANLTMADFVFFPQLAIVVRMGLDLQKYESLGKYYNRMCELKCVQDTWPPHWKESEGKATLKDIL